MGLAPPWEGLPDMAVSIDPRLPSTLPKRILTYRPPFRADAYAVRRSVIRLE